MSHFLIFAFLVYKQINVVFKWKILLKEQIIGQLRKGSKLEVRQNQNLIKIENQILSQNYFDEILEKSKLVKL